MIGNFQVCFCSHRIMYVHHFAVVVTIIVSVLYSICCDVDHSSQHSNQTDVKNNAADTKSIVDYYTFPWFNSRSLTSSGVRR